MGERPHGVEAEPRIAYSGSGGLPSYTGHPMSRLPSGLSQSSSVGLTPMQEEVQQLQQQQQQLSQHRQAGCWADAGRAAVAVQRQQRQRIRADSSSAAAAASSSTRLSRRRMMNGWHLSELASHQAPSKHGVVPISSSSSSGQGGSEAASAVDPDAAADVEVSHDLARC